MMFGDFMMGARSRLLPASVPFGFFGAATVLHVVAWAVLVWGGDGLPGYQGGPGPVLAALHLVTLGVLAMSAMGAAFQLLPVATRRALRSVLACRVAFWSFVPGVVLLTHGLGSGQVWAMHGGGSLTVVGFAVFGLLVADNLRNVADMAVVARHAWTAVVALVALLVLAVLLLADFTGGFLPNRTGAAAAHAIAAGYGFMGMLALGFSFILVPMFALSTARTESLGRPVGPLAAVALAVAMAGVLTGHQALTVIGALGGLGVVGLHLAAMAQVMRARMRARLGDSFVLVRLAWGLLPVSLLVGVALALGVEPAVTAPLFGFVLVFGWLLTFLLGVMQRILPFLASMHSVGQGGTKPVLVSRLTADRPLRIHLICHCTALVLVAAGIVAGQGWLVRVGAVAGLAGAVFFLIFAALVWRRLVDHLKAHS